MVQYAFLAFVSFVAYKIADQLSEEDPEQALKDKKPTTLSDQGTWIPRVFGSRRVGASIGQVWDRFLEEQDIGGGGKGTSGSGGSTKQDVYFESGWHRLCISGGKGSRLRRIYDNGKLLWSGELWHSPGEIWDDPSGTEVELSGDKGKFRIYWGDEGQPVDQDLADHMPISSSWPAVISIVWEDKRLGGFPVWQLMEYELRTMPIEQDIFAGVYPLSYLGIGWTDSGAIFGVNNYFQADQTPYPYIELHDNGSQDVFNFYKDFGADFIRIEGQPGVADDAVYEVSKIIPAIFLSGTYYRLTSTQAVNKQFLQDIHLNDIQMSNWPTVGGSNYFFRAELINDFGSIPTWPPDAPHGPGASFITPVYYSPRITTIGNPVTGPFKARCVTRTAREDFANGRQHFECWIQGFGTEPGQIREIELAWKGGTNDNIHRVFYQFDEEGMTVREENGAHGTALNVGRTFPSVEVDWWRIQCEYHTNTGVSPTLYGETREITVTIRAVDDDYDTMVASDGVCVFYDTWNDGGQLQEYIWDLDGTADSDGVTRVYLGEGLFNARSGYGSADGGKEGVGTGVATGINIGYALYELLFQDWPWGLGLPQDNWSILDTGDPNENSLETLANLADTPTEAFAINLLVQYGSTFQATLTSILLEMGIVISWDSVTGKYGFKAVRPSDTPITIPADMQATVVKEGKRLLYEQSSVVVGRFADYSMKYKVATFMVSNDANVDGVRAVKQETIDLQTVTDRYTAVKAVNRIGALQSNELTSRSFSVLKGGRDLKIGDLVSLEGSTEELRIIGLRVDVNSPKVVVDALLDVYGEYEEPSTMPQIGGDTDDDDDGLPLEVPDAASALYEYSSLSSPDGVSIAVLRIRADDSQQGSTALISRDDSTYESVQATLVTGGTLLRDISSTGRHRITAEDNIFFRALGPDILRLTRVVSNELFVNGGQQMLIGGELFFIQSIVAVGTNIFKLGNCLRARRGSVREDHTVGDTLFIFQEQGLIPSRHQLLGPSTMYHKTFPANVDPSTVSSQSTSVTLKAIYPQPVKNFRTDAYGGQFRYATGESITLKWNYVHPMGFKARTGAGFQGYGEKCGVSDLYDAHFRIVMSVSGQPDFTYTTTDLTMTFSNAVIQTWGGGSEPSLITMTIYFVYRKIDSALESASCFKL